jgi:DNA polymerase-1
LIEKKFKGVAYQLLQVHDELIFEVKEAAAKSFAEALTKSMEGVYQISVPLTVEVSIGHSWGEI